VEKIIPTQAAYRAPGDYEKICSLHRDVIEGPTEPLIHPMARFWYIHRGRGRLKLQERTYGLEPGTVVSILPWQISDITEVEQPLQYYFLAYDYDNINAILKTFRTGADGTFQLLGELRGRPVVHCTPRQARQFRRVLEEIRSETGAEPVDAGRPADELRGPYLVGKLMELMVLYCRIGRTAGEAGQPVSIQKSDVLHYIYCHLGQKLTLERLSKLFFMSESTISGYIRRTTGLSFYELLNEMRIGKALNYLLYTDLTIGEVGELLGFSDSAHMSKVFRDKTGMQASEYRRMYRKVGALSQARDEPGVYELVAYISRNCTEALTPQGVAERFHLTQAQLHEILVYQVERGFVEFLNYQRINRACVLLKTTGHAVTDIAIEVGYNNLKTFNRNFLRFRGMTAREFRRKVGLQKERET